MAEREKNAKLRFSVDYLTGKALKYNQDTNPEAGAFWFVRMKAAHAQDIVEEANRVANSK